MRISPLPILRQDCGHSSFNLTAFDGSRLDSGNLRGRIVVLAFWASWCLPCRWELPEVQAAQSLFKDDPGVLFLAVDVAWGGETPQRGQAALTRLGLKLQGAFDEGEAARKFHVDALPTLIVIDARGRMRMIHHGYDKSERVSEEIVTTIRGLQAGAGRPLDPVAESGVLEDSMDRSRRRESPTSRESVPAAETLTLVHEK